jgi:hypothetical protein
VAFSINLDVHAQQPLIGDNTIASELARDSDDSQTIGNNSAAAYPSI